jgi:hypothetical protein
MQLISIQILYIMHNTLASINYKRIQVSKFGTHWSLSCLKEKLESVKLHKVVPQAPLQRPSPRTKNLHDTGSYMQ